MELLRYQPENNIEIGAKVPDFILVDHENKTLRLRDLLGSPAVPIFILKMAPQDVYKKPVTSEMYITISLSSIVRFME
tara:strand:+ start:169 stop:402 length:234 start_codon:yes stop_codon:yes gene_type:complete